MTCVPTTFLQEIAKHFEHKSGDDYEVVVEAIDTMTCVAWYINDMKRKHEHAIRQQEIQSLLLQWKGPDLTTYGELVLEGSFRAQRARSERAVFLFDKLLLITKRRGDHYVYKSHIPVRVHSQSGGLGGGQSGTKFEQRSQGWELALRGGHKGWGRSPRGGQWGPRLGTGPGSRCRGQGGGCRSPGGGNRVPMGLWGSRIGMGFLGVTVGSRAGKWAPRSGCRASRRWAQGPW